MAAKDKARVDQVSRLQRRGTLAVRTFGFPLPRTLRDVQSFPPSTIHGRQDARQKVVILLVTPLPAARDCCARLQQATEEPVVTAQSFLEALARLRTASYTSVVFDRHLIEAEPNEFLTTCAHLGDAVLLEINFALTGIDRLMHEVQAALQRREHNLAAVHAAAARALQNEFSENLTALLLDCELAVNIPDLPPAAATKLASIQETAERLRKRLALSAAAGD